MSRVVPDAMTEAWLSPNKTGSKRPIVRATIQRQHLLRFEYDTAWAQGGTFDHDRHRTGHYATMIFGDNTPYREIPNIKNCSWERSVGQDAATCTLTLLNTEFTELGSSGDPNSRFDQPGFFTYNRGDEATRWGYEDNGWNGIFVPDMVVKTYEGYGVDYTVAPAADEHLMQSGVWMIDKVSYGTDGSITLEMRDLARLLLDQVVFPPVVPAAEYPLTWIKNHSENVPSRDPQGGHWKDRLRTIGSARSSNELYAGAGLTDAPYAAYVGSGGGVQGHHPSHVIVAHDRGTDAEKAADDATYWLSTGQDSEDSFVWWEFDADDPVAVAGVRIRMHGGPVRCYISIHNGDKWLGKKKIDYRTNGVAGSPGNVDIHADIPFVKSVIADRYWAFDVTLPRKYNAKKIRLTFTRLFEHQYGEHPYRVGLREMQIYTAAHLSDLSFHKGEVLKVIGNYGDYTNIVKWVCAWAGWYWPPHSTGKDFIRVQSGDGTVADKDWVTFAYPDMVLVSGRVWGDFMKSGTAGVADLTVDQFDKKPLMDIINYVRDLLGYLFFIDETGGVVFRMPNLWSLGSYRSPAAAGDGRPGHRGRGAGDASPDHGRTSEVVTIDEEETLLSYETVLDSSNVRERIFVANAVGGYGTVIKGFNPYPIGLKRVAGWSDQHFKSKRDAQVMADMISAQIMFSYRTTRITTPGYPAIQVDDQVRIYERVANETFYHYVMGIKSEIDMETGVWTYDMDTHWLGENPEDAWVVRVDELHFATQQYMAAIGYNSHDSDDADWELGPGTGGA